jgi:hypothetical protein
MKKDRFYTLISSIENEIETLAINYRLAMLNGHADNLDSGYLLGYRAACLRLLGIARSIEERDRRHIPEWHRSLGDVYAASSIEHWRTFVEAYEEYVQSSPVLPRSIKKTT